MLAVWPAEFQRFHSRLCGFPFADLVCRNFERICDIFLGKNFHLIWLLLLTAGYGSTSLAMKYDRLKDSFSHIWIFLGKCTTITSFKLWTNLSLHFFHVTEVRFLFGRHCIFVTVANIGVSNLLFRGYERVLPKVRQCTRWIMKQVVNWASHLNRLPRLLDLSLLPATLWIFVNIRLVCTISMRLAALQSWWHFIIRLSVAYT